MSKKSGVIRPLKEGGCSMCKASDKNVGKKKCRHILGSSINITEEHGIRFIDIKGEDQFTKDPVAFKVQPTEEAIINFFDTCGATLTKKEKILTLKKMHERFGIDE